VKGYDRSKEGVQKVVDPNTAKKSKVTDRTREANIGTIMRSKISKRSTIQSLGSSTLIV
jgi:hypothetical protein